MTIRIEGTHPLPEQRIETKPQIDRAFSSFLTKAVQKKPTGEAAVRISNHAQKRLAERGLQLEKADISVLETAFKELNQKGSKDSLIFYKDMALIASVNNRTIITAQNRNELRTITNIDSAIQL